MGYGSEEIKVTVDKGELLERLKMNREQHLALYTEAQGNYRKIVTAEVQRRLLIIESGGDIDLNFVEFVKPVSFEDDFNTAIGMLEWHTDSEISLTREDFMKYVENNWEWKTRFQNFTVGYTTSAA